MTRVYCAECGESLSRRPKEIAENKTGLFFCNVGHKEVYWAKHPGTKPRNTTGTVCRGHRVSAGMP